MNNYRPVIKLQQPKWQNSLNVFSYTLFIIASIVSMISLFFLPAEVPIHFNLAGEVDNYGSKFFLLLLPIITIVTILPLEVVERKPHLHNYMATLTEENVKDYYALSITTVNLLKNGVLVIFALLQFEILLQAFAYKFVFGAFFIVLVSIIVIAPIVWNIIASKKIAKKYKKAGI